MIWRLKGEYTMPWIICGDFNEILYAYEKKGGILSMNDEWRIFDKYWRIVIWWMEAIQDPGSLGK